jgi:hypothetical protein
MKFCKDCRYARVVFTERWECDHPSARVVPSIDLVTGQTGAPWQASCEFARSFRRSMCGPEGAFWEPREIGFGKPDDE